MFERYTEKARRVIFFSRYEASMSGSKFIEDRHLLLGLIREARALFTDTFDDAAIEEVRRKFTEQFPSERIATSADLPLSPEAKRILGYAAEEAERLEHQHIGSQHLLLGLMRQADGTAAKILAEHGFNLTTARKKFRTEVVDEGAPPMTGWIGYPHPLIRQLLAKMTAIPEERHGLAQQLLQALTWDKVTVSVTGSGGSFTFTVEKATGPEKS